MSLGLTNTSTFDQVARAIIVETRRRGYTRDESIAVLSTAIQESGLRMVWHSNGRWHGYFQQDSSYPDRLDPNGNILGFLDRLDQKRSSAGASPDIWLNIFWLQQRPSDPSAQTAYDRGRKAYLDEIKRHVDHAARLYDHHTGDTMRPDFNEFPIWSKNFSSRSGKKPTMFLIHTQEGGGGDAAAENLAKWFQTANQVSYHYTISQASDGGVTVVDCVDTDFSSWSVGNANSISINLCFAGSRAAWTRDQWLKQRNAIDVAAYLAVQDAKKYGFSTLVVPPPYTNGTPGISDHRWVTDVFGWGTHTDVGPNFPWDVFTAAVTRYASGPAPAKRFPQDWSDRELLEYIAAQLGPEHSAWPEKWADQSVDGKPLTLRDGMIRALKRIERLIEAR